MKQNSGEPRYRIERMIGNGCFGHVFEVVDLNTDKKIALKRMVKTSQKISREYEILKALHGCENVIQMEDFFYSLNYKGDLIQNFVFEHCQGNLEDALTNHVKGKLTLDYRTIKRLIFNLLKGLKALHVNKIAHRDFKPENVLIKDGDVKVADLGSAKVLLDVNSPYVVSRYYRAPELILGVSEYTLSIDMWALGVMFFEFLFKRLPFKGKTEGHHLLEIFRKLGVPPKEIQLAYKKVLGPYYIKAFELLWTMDVEDSIWEQLDKLHINPNEKANIKKFLQECWTYDFVNRIDAVKAFDLSFFDDVRHSDIKLNLSML